MTKLEELYEELLDTVSRGQIYDTMMSYYDDEFRKHMMAGGEKVDALTRQDIKTHFEKTFIRLLIKRKNIFVCLF